MLITVMLIKKHVYMDNNDITDTTVRNIVYSCSRISYEKKKCTI